MNGLQLIQLLSKILGGENISQTYALQLFNITKDIIEDKRPWKKLSVENHALTVTGSNTYKNPFPLTDDFRRYLGESTLAQGSIVLFDGNNNIQVLTEVPIENILFYKDTFGRFAVDYANDVFYITGVVPGTFNIYQYYIRTTDEITLTTKWQNFPKRYHPILAFDAACRWRLGTDYDDVNARNADDNGKVVNMMLDAMSSWDAELAISAINSIDYRNDRSPNYLNNRSNNSYLP